MAEGFLRQFHGDTYDVRSAGTNPQKYIHPLAPRVMREIGVDISAQYPKQSNDFLGRLPVRHLLLVCGSADASCPRIWPGAFSRTFMPFDDPAAFVGSEEEKLAECRRVRDLIQDAMKTSVPNPTLWKSAFPSQQSLTESKSYGEKS